MWFQAILFPFYCSFTIQLLRQLFGRISFIHTFFNCLWIVCEIVFFACVVSVVNFSLSILQMPGNLLFFGLLVTFVISSLVGGPSSISNVSRMGSSTDGVSTGSSRFSTSLKCSAHRFSCSYYMVILAPFLSFTGQ